MDNNKRQVEIKHKIDTTLVAEYYIKAKKEKGEKRRKLLKQAFYLSRHIGKYLVVSINPESYIP